MSAFGVEADISWCTANVCYWPKADVCGDVFIAPLRLYRPVPGYRDLMSSFLIRKQPDDSASPTESGSFEP
jgi:hypothetical protein